MEDLDVNTIFFRGMFVSVTLQAAVHLGKDLQIIYIPSRISPNDP